MVNGDECNIIINIMHSSELVQCYTEVEEYSSQIITCIHMKPVSFSFVKM